MTFSWARRILTAIVIALPFLGISTNVSAILLQPGDVYTVDFTISGPEDPPYERIRWEFDTGTDKLEIGETLLIDVFDDTGALLLSQNVVGTSLSATADIFTREFGLPDSLTSRDGMFQITALGSTTLELEAFSPMARPTFGGTIVEGPDIIDDFVLTSTSVPESVPVPLLLSALAGVVWLRRSRRS